MIPAQGIVTRGNLVRWTDQQQVEQDLIIGRALGKDAGRQGTLRNLMATRTRSTMLSCAIRS